MSDMIRGPSFYGAKPIDTEDPALVEQVAYLVRVWAAQDDDWNAHKAARQILKLLGYAPKTQPVDA